MMIGIDGFNEKLELRILQNWSVWKPFRGASDDSASSVGYSFKKRRKFVIESIFDCHLGSKRKIGSEDA
jgi:hypothetical protein